MTNIRWRTLFAVLSVFAVMAIAVACGDDDDDAGGAATVPSGGTTTATQATGGGGTTPTTSAPKGTITIRGTQFQSWDPHYANFAQDITHFFMVWRGAYEFDLESKPIPSMADGDPTVSSDGKTYTVKLKKDLKWSDGTPMTAKDFVAGVQRTCDHAVAGEYQYILTAIVGCDAAYDAKNAEKPAAELATLRAAVGVRAVDDLTVEYKLTDPQPTFPILLAMWPTFPVPTAKVKDIYDPAWPGPMENVYNGPFKPSAYSEKSSIELVPNTQWVGAQKAQVEKIVIRYIDDASVANNAYRAGELDASLANLAELDKLKDRVQIREDGRRTLRLSRHSHHRPGIQPGRRPHEECESSSRAFPRDRPRDAERSGEQERQHATTSWVPPARNGLKGGEYDKVIGFDAAAAKKLLADAGFADGKDFPELTMLLVDTAVNKDLGAFLQAEYKKHLNIDMKLEFVDSKTRSARFNSGEYQMVTGGWQEDYPDPENWFIGLWETDGSINKTNTSIKALDDLVAGAKFNQNDEARREAYRKAEQTLLAEASGVAPLWHTQATFLVKPYIKGMVESKRPGDTFTPGDWNPENWTTTK